MKVLNLALSGALVALVGMAACNENPIDTPTGNGPGAVTLLKASSRSESSVALSWGAPATAATSYGVSWAGTTDATAATGKIDTIPAAVPSALITGLAPNTEYTFTVTSRNATGTNVATIKWAGANRYTGEPTTGIPIRIYEKASTLGSAITLDPALGGPKNVSVKKGTAGKAQIAFYINAAGDSLVIGSLYAIPEYKSSADFDLAKVDSSVYISTTTFAVSDLNSWFVDKSIDQFISSIGNVSGYTFPVSLTQSQGFFVRTGTGQVGNLYHYARILVKTNGGKVVQGSVGNRYIELEISFQNAPNLPYAKRVAGSLSPIGFYARVLGN